MTLPLKHFIKASLKTEWPKISLLVLLVILFTSNAMGLLEFRNNLFPGIEINTQVFGPEDASLQIPAVARSTEFLILLATSILLAIFLPLLSPIGASILVVVASSVPIYLGMSDPYGSTNIPMQYSLLVYLMLFGMNVLLKYFAETQQKQKLLAAFGQFVPREIVDELSSNPQLLSLDGESKLLTIIFCDLKNFTGLSEQLDPKEVVRLLNEYFTTMTEILYRHGATIDKYIGDSIMAFWGAPVPQEDHAKRAVSASFELHKQIELLSESFIKRGLPGPTMGIGINTGIVNVGNMGSNYRLAYTVIGDAVNLSFRLQNMTRIYQVPTIVGENTVKKVSDMAFRELDTVTVRGKTRLTKIYQPIGLLSELSETQRSMLHDHHQALNFYYDEKYEKAQEIFAELLMHSEQEYYYQYMLSKIKNKISRTF